jgi:hypothetical protein
MTDAIYKLGKLAPKRLLGLPDSKKYTAALSPPPVSADYSKNLKHLGPMLNREIGCCTIAGVGHTIQTWTSFTQPAEVILPDSEILSLYSLLSGYVPGDPETDSGCAATDVLRYWYSNPIMGHKLSAFASVKPGNRLDVKNSIFLFGVCYVGVQLPLTAQNGPWDVAPGASTLTGDSAAGSWGGHLIPVIAYDEDELTCITWGMLKTLSWKFWDSYCDESYCMFGPDWIEKDEKSPSGFATAALLSDVQAIKQDAARR